MGNFGETLTMDELFWSSLPGIPQKMKWPVKVVKWLPKPLVYCKCDDAYFSVSRDQLVPFSDDVNVIETFKNKGIAALKKKKETKFRFLCDIEWANEALKQPRASHSLLPESSLAAGPGKSSQGGHDIGQSYEAMYSADVLDSEALKQPTSSQLSHFSHTACPGKSSQGGHDVGQSSEAMYSHTSQRMRDAARLLLNLKQQTQTDRDLYHYLTPQYFNDVVKAALTTSSPQFDDEEDLKSPSTAIKLGYDIKRMVGSKWAMCLKTGAREEVDKCNDFLKLMQLEWSLKVSKIALVTLQTRRFNAVRLLPVPDDLVKLQDHVKSELTGQRLEAETVHLEIYRRVVELCQTRLLLYNKRRSGEIEAITVKQYTKRQSGVSDIDRSMRAHLSKLEEHLLVSQELIETRGKGGRGVPVIVPSDTKRALQFISNIGIRHEAGILPDNIYLFPNTKLGAVRAYDSLKKICNELHLKQPEQITSVNMRKYTATISQIFDMSTQEQQWLTNHLGHSLEIHKVHYRQTSGVIERVDIAKLMLLQEFDIAGKYAGKKLADIDMQELVFGSETNMCTDTIELQTEIGGGTAPLNGVSDDEMQPDIQTVDTYDEYEFQDEDSPEEETKRKSKSQNSMKFKKKNSKEKERVKVEGQRRKDKKKKKDKKERAIKEEKKELTESSDHFKSETIENDSKIVQDNEFEDAETSNLDNMTEDVGYEEIYNDASEIGGEYEDNRDLSEDGMNEGEPNTEDTQEVVKFQTSLQKERLEKRKQKRKAKREKLKALVKKKEEPKSSKNTKTEGLLWKKFKEVAKDSEGNIESDTEETEPEKFVCENIEDEPDPVKKAIRLKKREKRQKKKLEKWLKRKMYKERAGTAGPSAIRYLHYWENNRERWRFMKVRHVWLMKNMFNCEMIDNDDFDLILRYLEPSNDKTKSSLVQEAEEIIANIEKEVADNSDEDEVTVPSHFTEVMGRARQVIQTLAV